MLIPDQGTGTRAMPEKQTQVVSSATDTCIDLGASTTRELERLNYFISAKTKTEKKKNKWVIESRTSGIIIYTPCFEYIKRASKKKKEE